MKHDQRVLLGRYPCGEVLVIFDSFATYMRTVERIFSFCQESWISNFQHVEYCIEYFISSLKFMIWVSNFVWHFFFWWVNLFLLLGFDYNQGALCTLFQLILSNSFFLFKKKKTTGDKDAYHDILQTPQKWEHCTQGTTFTIMKKILLK